MTAPHAPALHAALSDLPDSLRRLCARRIAEYLRHRAACDASEAFAVMFEEEADAVEAALPAGDGP